MTNDRNDKNEQKSTAATTGVTPAGKQDNATEGKSEQDKAAMMNVEIKKVWNKLTDEDIKLYDRQPDQFFSKLKEKHSVSKEDGQKRLQDIKTSCGCSSTKAA